MARETCLGRRYLRESTRYRRIRTAAAIRARLLCPACCHEGKGRIRVGISKEGAWDIATLVRVGVNQLYMVGGGSQQGNVQQRAPPRRLL